MNFPQIKLPTFNQGASFVIGIISITFLVFVHTIDPEVKGALIGLVVAMGHFLIGSTSGSQAKDDIIANSTPPQTKN